MPSLKQPLLLFLALFALYSPVAALSSYFPIVRRLKPGDQKRLALGLFTYVAVFSLVALWVGEPLLELLGLSTDALTVTGGIALMYAAIPIMRGTEEPPPKEVEGEGAPAASWKSVLFMPVTFPLTVGGTTFAFFVSYRAQAKNLLEVVALSVAGLLYAAVTGFTLFLSGHVERRASPGQRTFLERIAGILLVAIAVTLLLGGGPRLVATTLENFKK